MIIFFSNYKTKTWSRVPAKLSLHHNKVLYVSSLPKKKLKYPNTLSGISEKKSNKEIQDANQ